MEKKTLHIKCAKNNQGIVNVCEMVRSEAPVEVISAIMAVASYIIKENREKTFGEREAFDLSTKLKKHVLETFPEYEGVSFEFSDEDGDEKFFPKEKSKYYYGID